VHVPVVVVGAGPGGLAMSHHLTGAGIDHVVLERGEVANSWRHERWDSLRLLTPNWMTALPGYGYEGSDPDGYMTARETADVLDGYRRQFDPPVLTGVTVESARAVDQGFNVRADGDEWRCDALVAATGASSEPRLPALAAEVPARIDQVTALAYRNPGQLARDRGVLVVGASASGVQIADELARAGHDVTISVGEHIRLPRSYRGRDIYWWLDRIGQLDERYDEVDDLDRARRHASVQLVGTDQRRDIDLNALRTTGVQVVGRFMAVRGTTAQFSGALTSLVANADLKQNRLLRRADELVVERAMAEEVGPATEPEPTWVGTPPTELDLDAFSTVVWATGHRPKYPWLDAAAFDRKGRVAHDGGVASLPGLYLLGLPLLRRRRSNLLAGLGDDAAELLEHLRGHLDSTAARRPPPSRSDGRREPLRTARATPAGPG
jgi:putative flavoprotein involved in K+ transport